MLWSEAGEGNTKRTVELAVAEAEKRKLPFLLVASNTGRTAQAVLDEVKGDLQVICVTHHVGFKEPGHDEMEPEKRQELQEQGAKVLTTTHVLAGVDRAVRNQFGGLYPPEIIANGLRMLGQGVKVCVEISIMALDSGLIPYGADVIAIGGTSRGADTAAIIRPAHSNNVFDTRIVEILCRPRP
ncbi:MAG: pyruvate kinase alpha/beta domain-containing protein [Limnochordia bacterium]